MKFCVGLPKNDDAFISYIIEQAPEWKFLLSDFEN